MEKITMNTIDEDLLSVQEARILAENARDAQKVLAAFPQEKLDSIVESIAGQVEQHAAELAKMSCEETDYGIWQDKYIKNRFVCIRLRSQLRKMRCVGIIREDAGHKTMDVGVPLGVLIALCPATSPVSTAVYTAMIAIKSGNAVVFSPHPRARESIAHTLDIMIVAAEQAGLPEGALSYLHTVTAAGTKELFMHPAVSLILDTGVPGVLPAAYSSGKPVIYGGNGGGPAFIERTADIPRATADILISKTFDNGIVSAAEQSVVADRCVSDQVKSEFLKRGGYFLSEQEARSLGNLLFFPDGGANPELMGKTARELARRAGFFVPESTMLLISEQKYVSKKSPFLRENLCPVIAYYEEEDWMHACEKCIELLLSEKKGHTLVIHSQDEEVIRQFALKKPVGRVLVNTPAVFGSMGATTNLFPAMTLGSGVAGSGITSDNVSPMNLIYVRKVGYGVCSAEQFKQQITSAPEPKKNPDHKEQDGRQEAEILGRFLKGIVRDLKDTDYHEAENHF